MDEQFLKILSVEEEKVRDYVSKRLYRLNLDAVDYYDISMKNNECIYSGWIDVCTDYFPYGTMAMGFKLDISFITDFAFYIREHKDDFSLLKTTDSIIDYINNYTNTYFGEIPDERVSMKFYKYGYKEYVGRSYRISELREKSVARSLERAVFENTLFNFIGLDSSLAISNNHAFSLILEHNVYKIADSTQSIDVYKSEDIKKLRKVR